MRALLIGLTLIPLAACSSGDAAPDPSASSIPGHANEDLGKIATSLYEAY